MRTRLLKAERQQRLYRYVQETSQARVSHLSGLFGVSEATIRRDLEELAVNGLLRRIHGGAILVERAAPELPIIERDSERQREKQLIGKAAARLVKDGETIFIGSGTTAFQVVRNLTEKRDLTVITNALNVANALVGHPNINVVVIGGLLRHSELSLIGHLAELVLKELRADKVIMGIRAIDIQHGLTNEYLPETLTDRAIIRSGARVILVADHTKFNRISTAFVAPLSSVHTIVTDPGVTPDIVATLTAMGIEVVIAEEESLAPSQESDLGPAFTATNTGRRIGRGGWQSATEEMS